MPANNLKHGGKGTRLYECWKHMKARCYTTTSKDYPAYGGRGITVCDEWKTDFSAFRSWAQANGYKEYLTLDRSDNNKSYTPDNCQWSTDKVQANNRRNSLSITAFEETKTVAMWASDSRCKVAVGTLYYRVNMGWPGERALTESSRIKTPMYRNEMKWL